jgi:hypothetical protein
MSDLWADGQIDCKDYALFNAARVRSMGAVPTFVLTPKEHPKHIFVVFEKDGVKYALDNDKMFVVRNQ